MTQNKELVSVKNFNTNSINELLKTQHSISPVVDIYENENDFVLVADLPGVERSNIQVKIDDENLIVFGKINFNEAVNRKYILNETEIGNYYRSFKISDSIDKEKINAKYDNGQLLVTLPKHDKVKPREIDIV
ncbi:MAG: Hsp20/alpha crystallin family protein [Ignavibacteria bacterium]|nr:Hsp20/alpha crystallin family protein [Ignavibacteria bacterium]MBT8382629.1 Hsp20/alpha crystallin family protein [Ignavibacteria bacterium]MBT8392107.1 Hsp20/alpha crystallin family protein [Ignavibacteria bacterium]NNJ52443.1 Hsp20/alpha crystallin family protein [Ignavibacteriaceae bacterium]NNL21811.1 Hsp20/alpha crystallin family protein [Ignavibacteriaceae bacterium]